MKRVLIIIGVLALAALSLVIGVMLGRATSGATTNTAETAGAAAQAQEVWTCSMHPQVRMEGPGMCPICDMPLVPAASASASAGEIPSLHLGEHALAMASVETTPVRRSAVSKDVRAVGKIEYNESTLSTITARIDGYAERLFVNFTGVDIKAGDHLVEVYSPDLLVAQQELLIAQQASTASAAGGEKDMSLVDAARIKLRLYGLSDKQIDELIASRRLAERITLYSPIDGTVIEKNALENSAFKSGDALYRIANLDTVWVYLDIYEFDLAWLRYGQKVEITTEAYPGRVFEGMVTFVQPFVNEATRAVRVPVHVENPDHALKPGMFVSAVVKAALGADGLAAPTGVEGKYTCPMHPQVLQDEDGACPICEMPLERIPFAETVAQEDGAPAEPLKGYLCPMKCEGEKLYEEPGRCPVCNMRIKYVEIEPPAPPPSGTLLVVPSSAVLDSGTRKIVYIEKERGLFEPREIVTGPRTGDVVPILSGLQEGERVVTRGGFLIDSQFQITGHSSLFYPGGLHASMGHEHGSSEMPAESPPADTPPADAGHKH